MSLRLGLVLVPGQVVPGSRWSVGPEHLEAAAITVCRARLPKDDYAIAPNGA